MMLSAQTKAVGILPSWLNSSSAAAFEGCGRFDVLNQARRALRLRGQGTFSTRRHMSSSEDGCRRQLASEPSRRISSPSAILRDFRVCRESANDPLAPKVVIQRRLCPGARLQRGLHHFFVVCRDTEVLAAFKDEVVSRNIGAQGAKQGFGGKRRGRRR